MHPPPDAWIFSTDNGMCPDDGPDADDLDEDGDVYVPCTCGEYCYC